MSSDGTAGLSPGRLAWMRLRRDRVAMAGLAVIALAVLMAASAYLLIPDNTPHANRQAVELAAKPPGSSFTFLLVPLGGKQEPASAMRWLSGSPPTHRHIPIHSYAIAGDTLYAERYTGDEPNDGERMALAIAALCDGMDKGCLAQPEKHVIKRQRYLLGTDRFGRDLLSRMALGARVSLSVGLVAVGISLVIGVALGAMAGFFGGWVDRAVMWFVTVVWSIPLLLLVIAITLALGKGFFQVFIAVGLAMWTEVARIVRAQVMSLREKEFIEACRALGYGPGRTIIRHILPNVTGPVTVVSAANFASAILIEAGLSFLGVGAQPPMPSWGAMIKDHYGYIIMDKAYLAIVPGAAILLMVLSFTLLGNGLRDALDVRARR